MGGNVRILGAGVAGLVAAISLVRAGFTVEIFEKKSDCGTRFHGDLQGIENWSRSTDALSDLRCLKINTTFRYSSFSRVLQVNRHRIDTINLSKPGFYVVRRGLEAGSLDQSLKEQALEAGVIIHFQQIIPVDEADIVAIGPSSDRVPVIAKGITFRANCEDIAIVYYCNEVAPRGYAYLLAADGRGCLATVLFRSNSQAGSFFQKAHDALLSRFPITLSDVRNFGGFGQFLPQSKFLQGNTLFVGEAAGLQDFLWGFGIRSAIESGALAAHSLSVGSDYQQVAQRFFKHRQRASIVNRFLWECLGRKDYLLIMSALRRHNVRLLYSMYNENTLQQIFYPLARLWYMLKY